MYKRITESDIEDEDLLGSDSDGGGNRDIKHYITDIDIGSGQLWTPFKTLFNVVTDAIDNPTIENIHAFRSEVTKCKAHFQARQLLTSRPRSTFDRDDLKKCITEPKDFYGHDIARLLPAQLVNESILLSDLFEINEFQALDLLVTGEAEMDNYPCWPRGLVAVYIYFEGQYSLVAALRTLLKICPGNTWGSTANAKIVEISSSVLNQCLVDDFMDKIINLLDKYDAQKQMESLDANLGLGDWRHRTRVLGYIKGIRETIGEILFYWSCQRGLMWTDALRILEYLKTHILNTEEYKVTKEDVYLISSVMYAIDFHLNKASIDKDFAKEIKKYCNDNMSTFRCPQVLELMKLAYHTIVHRRSAETSLRAIHGGVSTAVTVKDIIGDDVLEFRNEPFKFMRTKVFEDKETFAHDEHIMRIFHQIFSDFISYLPSKIKELKSKSEDVWKMSEMYNEQGFNRPSELAQEYENFLETLGVFYEADRQQELAKDFFRPEAIFGSLNKLVRGSCVDVAGMFLPNVKMLAGLGFSYPIGVFDILKQSGHNLSMDHFYNSITKYLQSVGGRSRGEVPYTTHGSVHQSDMFQRVVTNPTKLKPGEILSICGYIEILKSICSSEYVQLYFTTTNRQWFQATLNASKERGFPREIRIQLVDLAGCMVIRNAPSTEYIMAVWEAFYTARLVEIGTPDLREELNEQETRLESYPITINFLKLIDILVSSRFSSEENSSFYDAFEGASIDGTLLDPYVSFVRDMVLQRIPYRSYKDIKDRWALTKLSLRIVSNLLDFVPNLMVQMLCDSPLLRSCLTVLTDCTRVRVLSTGPVTHVDECSYEALNLMNRVYERQTPFLYRRDTNAIRYNVTLIGIHELLMKVHGETGRAEYLIALLRFVDKLNPETHRDLALQILSRIVAGQSETDLQLYATVISDPNLSTILRYTFCECLENPNCSQEVQNDVLELLRNSVTHPSPNFGFFMLGVDKKIDFQLPGVNGSPKTVIHSLLGNLVRLPAGFRTLFVLIRDSRLSAPLLRFLRTNQVLVKFYIEHFPRPEMEVESVGYFLKCLAIELKSTPQTGPLTHAMVGQYSRKFAKVLENIVFESDNLDLPALEFFDATQIDAAFKSCEYRDKELKVNLINHKKLEDIFKADIAQLDRPTVIRLRKSIQGEAKQIVAFAKAWNDARKREASKIFLFDCWRQTLEILVLSVHSLKVAGVEFLTSMLRHVTEKVVKGETASDTFQRLAAESSVTLCAILNVFTLELSESTLNVIVNNLCTWTAQEASSTNRTLLYSSILYVMRLLRDKKANVASHSSFALIIETLCKDAQNAADIGKMQAMFLLGEIIRWNMGRGLGGVIPNNTPLHELVNTAKHTDASSHNMTDQSLNVTGNTSISEPVVQEMPSSPYAVIDPTFSTISSRKGSRLFTIPGSSTLHSLDNVADKRMLTKLVINRTVEKTQVTQGALMTFLQSKGFLKNIVSSLSLSDDENLMKLFSTRPGSTHVRALLVYEAKMFMLTRLARTGAKAVELLLGANLMQRLADMNVFQGGFNMEDEFIRPFEYSIADSVDPLMEMALPTKVDRLDNLYTNVLLLLHGLAFTSTKSDELTVQIWNFLLNHDEAFGKLVIYPGENEKIPQSLFLFTSLAAAIVRKAPRNTFSVRTLIFRKMTGILRIHVRLSGMSLEQLRLTRDSMCFIYNYAKQGIRVRKPVRPCNLILTTRMEYAIQTPYTDLSIGLILKVVHETSKLAYQTYDQEDDRTNYLVSIMEIGLTLAYWHIEITLKGMFSKTNEFQKDQLIFQQSLKGFLEDGFMRDVLEATEIFVYEMDYMKTMLMAIRRLAHLQKY